MSKVLVKLADDTEEFYGFTIIDYQDQQPVIDKIDQSSDYSLLDFVFIEISDEEAETLEKHFPGGFGVDFYADFFPQRNKIEDIQFILGE